MYIRFIKPFGSWLAALLFLVVLSPVFLIIILILLFANKGNVFFVQKRPGWNGKPFYLLKFKTMTDRSGPDGLPLPDLARQTLVGNFLRNFHLDELPQCINILKGDMDLIGPRPLLMEYMPHYTSEQLARHECKPGIIGLVQVMGGNQLPWHQRMRLDIFYARHVSFQLDFLILWRTVKYFFGKKMKGTDESLFGLETFIEHQNRSSNLNLRSNPNQ